MTHRGVMHVIAACVLTLLLAGHASAVAVLRVAVQEDSAPKFVIGERFATDAVEGICPDIMRALERVDPGLRFVYETQPLPLRRVTLRMEQARVDANCLVSNEERRARFQVGAITLFSFDYYLIARAGDTVNIKGWDDVRSLGADGRILVLSGTGVMERLNKLGGLNVEESGKSATVNLRKLVMGRGRFFYYRTYGWDEQVRAAKVGGQVRILPLRMESVRFHLVLGKHIGRDVAARVERAVRQLDANGTLAGLRAKWLLDGRLPD